MAVIVGGASGITVKTKFVEAVEHTIANGEGSGSSAACPGIRRDDHIPGSVISPKDDIGIGTSVVFEDVPESVRALGAVSGSPMVKAIDAVGVFSIVD